MCNNLSINVLFIYSYSQIFFLLNSFQLFQNRNQVFEALSVAGLKDQHNYFKKELDGWDVWNLEDKDRSAELRRMCKDWLDRYETERDDHPISLNKVAWLYFCYNIYTLC